MLGRRQNQTRDNGCRTWENTEGASETVNQNQTMGCRKKKKRLSEMLDQISEEGRGN